MASPSKRRIILAVGNPPPGARVSMQIQAGNVLLPGPEPALVPTGFMPVLMLLPHAEAGSLLLELDGQRQNHVPR